MCHPFLHSEDALGYHFLIEFPLTSPMHVCRGYTNSCGTPEWKHTAGLCISPQICCRVSVLIWPIFTAGINFFTRVQRLPPTAHPERDCSNYSRTHGIELFHSRTIHRALFRYSLSASITPNHWTQYLRALRNCGETRKRIIERRK